jgi:hypothetical protein
MTRRPTVAPLTLSLSLWERGRCCNRCALFERPFSRGEKDRMRGVTFNHYVTAARLETP